MYYSLKTTSMCLNLLAFKCAFSYSVSNVLQTLIKLRVSLLKMIGKETFYQYGRIFWFIEIVVGLVAIRLRDLTTLHRFSKFKYRVFFDYILKKHYYLPFPIQLSQADL